MAPVSISLAPEAGVGAVIDGDVLTVTLSRVEQLNAQSPRTWAALNEVQRQLPGNVRVAVLRADGRAFSAGLDRALFTEDGLPGLPSVLEIGRGSARQADALIASWQSAMDWTGRPALVSVAAVQGHAIGAGFQLALGCDIRIVAEDVQFCMAEPSLGLVPDLGGTKRLVDLVGASRATEICLTGRRVGAEEAYAIGLASHVVPREGLDAAVAATVDALLRIPRTTAAETKALLQSARGNSQEAQQAAERAAQYRLLQALAGRPDSE
ncbi:MAG TPA: enoyl-CoA hydratase/isomerase family protein [Jatrophihabitans sp.]|jgi:enoyl-CoA hydratase/carnithine racemase